MDPEYAFQDFCVPGPKMLLKAALFFVQQKTVLNKKKVPARPEILASNSFTMEQCSTTSCIKLKIRQAVPQYCLTKKM